ncbi:MULTISPECIES: hypothetical protein [unclassified Bosea (in: a-proteobacteria)]|uniref:hypothetical protein n=1 Tax=unclassified Bosea (in: a-proteobacteria) TaxID=2653178 RepID=UPI001914E391|nr:MULTISPECIES: hypothetical protein [unclassified Bosea (in: a-proteobacteria)]
MVSKIVVGRAEKIGFIAAGFTREGGRKGSDAAIARATPVCIVPKKWQIMRSDEY